MSHAPNRPISIHIAAIVEIFIGVIGFLWTCLGLLNMFMTFQEAAGVNTDVMTAGIGEFLIPFSLSLGQILVGFGVLKVRRWSWSGSLVLQVIVLLDSLRSIQHLSVPQLLNVVAVIALTHLLTRSDVRLAFRDRFSS